MRRDFAREKQEILAQWRDDSVAGNRQIQTLQDQLAFKEREFGVLREEMRDAVAAAREAEARITAEARELSGLLEKERACTQEAERKR